VWPLADGAFFFRAGRPRGQKGEGEVFLDKIQQLSPKDDNQRAVKAQATNLAIQIGQTRC
jgi:hypothetical protein